MNGWWLVLIIGLAFNAGIIIWLAIAWWMWGRGAPNQRPNQRPHPQWHLDDALDEIASLRSRIAMYLHCNCCDATARKLLEDTAVILAKSSRRLRC